MNKKFSVPEPCPEKWDGMQPQENGRYCGSCQKVVVDFTTKTYEEILDYIKENSGRKVCGTFKNSQLPPPDDYRHHERSIRFLAALLLVFGMSLFSCNSIDLGDKGSSEEQKEQTKKLDQWTMGIMIPQLDTTNIQNDSVSFLPPEIIEVESGVESCVSVTSGVMMIEDSLTENHIIYPEVITDSLSKAIPHQNIEPIVGVIDPMPHFDNHGQSLEEYLVENIKYPVVDEEQKREGTVYVTFVVRQDGSVADVKVLRGTGSAYEREAIRVITEMPKWKPTIYQGRAVDVQFNVPIKFRTK